MKNAIKISHGVTDPLNLAKDDINFYSNEEK
jgi:hypothetical protein